MKKLIAIIFFVFISSKAFSGSLSQDFIVAKINNRAITKLDLLERYKYVLALTKISPKSQKDSNLILSQTLDKMIDEELIRQESISFGISVNESDVLDAANALAQHQNKTISQIKNLLKNKDIPFEIFLNQVESELLWSRIVANFLGPKIKVSESEIRELFEQKKFNISVKKFFIAELSVARGGQGEYSDKLFAESLFIELKNGANFHEMVKQFSSGFSAESGGDIGWVSQGEIDKKVFEEISKLKNGEYSNPILLSDGYHIFKLIDQKNENNISEKDMRGGKNVVFARKIEVAARGHMIDIRKKAFVEKIAAEKYFF